MGNNITRFVVAVPAIAILGGIVILLIFGYIIMKYSTRKDQIYQKYDGIDNNYEEDKVYINKNKGQVKKYQ